MCAPACHSRFVPATAPRFPSEQDGQGRPCAEGPLGAVVDGVDVIADAVDRLLPVKNEPGNHVLADNARLVRWAVPLFGLCAVALVPWTVWLALTLPQRQVSNHYRLVWVGFDVMLMVASVATATTAMRRSRYLAVAASSTGALLLSDAWFDVTTSIGSHDLPVSIAMALLVELPLAALCFWLSMHSQDVAERRLVLVHRRRADHALSGGPHRLPSWRTRLR